MQLGWVDFSKSERSKILSILELLIPQGTLDELGIGDVRDGFSNLFFPGTSTIQTRAKYFFLVPYAMKQLEKSGETNPYKFLKELDRIEKESARAIFAKNENEDGLIGINSLKNGRWVKRKPSDIYWAGLRRYGIFCFENFSLSEYVMTYCKFKNEKIELKSYGKRSDAEDVDCDDKSAGEAGGGQFWKMPLYTKDWKENISMELTSDEKTFLKGQIIETCRGTMIAYVLENDVREFLDCTSFEELGSVIGKFPDEMQKDYFMALDFSEFVYALRVVYNVIVSDGKNEFAASEFEALLPFLGNVADVDVDQIFERLRIFKNPQLRIFLKKCKELMQNGDIDGLKSCISNREVHLKTKSRAKTCRAGEYDPRDWFGGGRLDYRFTNARKILKDIMESEEKADVKPQ